MRLLSVVGAALLTVGCTSTPKYKTMDADTYTFFSTHMLRTEKCFVQNMISPTEYAQSKQNIGYSLNTWVYQPDRLEREYTTMYNSTSSMTPSACREVQGQIAEATLIINKDVNRQQANANAQSTQWEQLSEIMNQDKTTWCHKVGSTVMCN
ncbi:hypothetical protein IT774_07425 [Salinimonas marina]|uniref:Lipoprotein n=1 Tax=Salinimonas marina TaxID=2785918 RepID=A0A7S9E0R8_9ALTE|nr:hypothetical protein [Salinimonas marina]QPG06925.1 hypothetical protein IT774_07425 [Salinimonas marina]